MRVSSLSYIKRLDAASLQKPHYEDARDESVARGVHSVIIVLLHLLTRGKKRAIVEKFGIWALRSGWSKRGGFLQTLLYTNYTC